MARKDRAPTPPRRVQAPQQRRTPSSADAVRRQKAIIYAAAGAGLLALAVVLVLVFTGGSSGGGDARATLEDAGCTVQIVDAVENRSDHSDVPTPTTKVQWNTDPPSNGPHYGQTIIFGAYDEPLQQQLLVHNYEHGSVGIQYGSSVADATVQQLRDFYDSDPNGLILAPLPRLGNQIALTAWRDATPGEGDKGEGVVAKCRQFDQGAFEAFLDAYGFQGPEAFPRDALQPGGN
jgi:Protein of unknown function (DUF3105)